MFLVDTNVLSELRRSRRDPNVVAWLEGVPAGGLQLSVITVATRWGRLCEAHPQFPTDILIAATALEYDLTVATGNVDHVRPARVRVVNPFVGSA